MTMQNDYILVTEDLFSYDSMDRLVSDGHYEYGYDALGNVTQRQPFGPAIAVTLGITEAFYGEFFYNWIDNAAGF